MPSTKVYVPIGAVSTSLAFVLENGTTYRVQASPPKFTYDGAAKWAVTKRDGLEDITQLDGPGLPVVSFDLWFWTKDILGDASPMSRAIQDIAERGLPVRIKGGSDRFEGAHWWRITSCRMSAEERGAGGEASRLTQSIKLEKYVKMPGTNMGKVKGTVTRSAGKASGTQKVGSTYTTQLGDSLWSIAAKTLGDGLRWREIHAANKAKVPNPNVIEPNLVLTIPAK